MEYVDGKWRKSARRKSELLEKVAIFNKKVEEHHEKQLSNPFSEIDKPADYALKKLDINDPNYGRYVVGIFFFSIFFYIFFFLFH